MRNRWGHNLHGPPSMEAPNFYLKYRGFSIRPYLSKYDFSNRIYNNVWSDCDYECYWMNNYDEYKKRVVANINLLRLSHGSGNVRQSDVLDEIAQNHANKMARKNTLFTEYSQMYGIIIGMSFYPAASVIVTKWYDEHRKYNFLKNRPQPGTQGFTQLIWKNEKLIGVGVAKSKDILFVACYFYPKGNIKNHYKRNVFRRRSRWFRGK
uniref:SCP domain-containing protein n=1 Tax=Strongyloides papillosus TaxID=174720 RepID=A0A0N5BTS9_STREA